ncbi:MAG: DUF2461 domain-containing protein [Bacteroidetes bacterium]|nr:DUF2461 domain-containing protein [Bacteroidota bacterium]
MIHTDTLSFLKKLNKNNNREWFEKNKAHYTTAKDNVEANVAEIIAGIRTFDKRIGDDLEARKAMFRIYRDVRFSANKAPYKNNLGASINPGGRMAPTPGYYIHIQPDGNSFVAGGMWMPEAPQLAKIRQEIDYNLDEFKALLKDKNFKKFYAGLDNDEGYTLSRPPKGYTPDNPAVEFLKYKSFTLSHLFSDEEVMHKNFTKNAIAACKAMHPFLSFLQRAID